MNTTIKQLQTFLSRLRKRLKSRFWRFFKNDFSEQSEYDPRNYDDGTYLFRRALILILIKLFFFVGCVLCCMKFERMRPKTVKYVINNVFDTIRSGAQCTKFERMRCTPYTSFPKENIIFSISSKPSKMVAVSFIWLGFLSFVLVKAEEPSITLCQAVTDQGYIAGKDGYVFREGELSVHFSPILEQQSFWKRHIEALEKYRGSHLLVAIFPRRGLFEQEFFSPEAKFIYDEATFLKEYEEYRLFYQGAGAISLSLLDIAKNTKALGHPVFFRRDHHKTPYFMQQSMQKIASVIKEQLGDIYLAQSPTDFTLTQEGDYDYVGSFSQMVMDACGTELAGETSSYVVAHQQNIGLFEDLPPSEYLLLCNSNCERGGTPLRERSPKEYQSGAPEFLKNYLQRSVLAHGVSGSGQASYESMLYNLLPTYEKGPDVLIYLPEIFDSELSAGLLRQLTPAVVGFKGDKLQEQEVAVSSGKNIIFDKTNLHVEALGYEYYLSVQFEDTLVNELELVLSYGEQTETILLSRADLRIHNPAVWHVELADSQSFATPLSEVAIVMPNSYSSTSGVKVQLMKLP